MLHPRSYVNAHEHLKMHEIEKTYKHSTFTYTKRKYIKKIPIDISIEKDLKKYAVNALEENHVAAFLRKLVGHQQKEDPL